MREFSCKVKDFSLVVLNVILKICLRSTNGNFSILKRIILLLDGQF